MAGIVPGMEQKFPAAPQDRFVMEQAVPQQPTGTTQSTPPCATFGSAAVDEAWRKNSPWRAPAGAGPRLELPSLQRATGAAAHGDLCWSSTVLKDGRPTMDQGWKSCHLWKPMWDQFGKDGNPWERPHMDRGRLAVNERQRLSIMD